MKKREKKKKTLSESASEMIKDVDGQTSSKRVVSFIAFAVMIVAFVASAFFGKNVEEYIFEGFTMIVAAGLFSTVLEKFSRKNVTRYEADINYTGDTPDVIYGGNPSRYPEEDVI